MESIQQIAWQKEADHFSESSLFVCMDTKAIYKKFQDRIHSYIYSDSKFRDNERLKREIKERSSVLHSVFTTHRSEKTFNYFKDVLFRYAYIEKFLAVNACKVIEILSELEDQPFLQCLKDKDEIHVLDVGAGPCTALFGFYEWYKGRQKLDLVPVDKDKNMLAEGKRLFSFYRGSRSGIVPGQAEVASEALSTINYVECNLSRRGELGKAVFPKKFDIIIAANFFNELGEQRQKQELRLGVLRNLAWSLLAREGIIIIIEPGTRIASKNLIGLREAFIASAKGRSSFHILAPCTHQSHCPLGKRDDNDWCFRSLYGINEDVPIGYSYLVIGKGENFRKVDSNSIRVISDIFTDKNEKVFLACASSGKQKLRLSEAAKSGPTIRRGVLTKYRPSRSASSSVMGQRPSSR
jgi:ribosomal protein RSM22 (predicted rRNA methylase)